MMPVLRILTDEVDFDPILNFGNYSESIADLIKSSNPKFSIGIYGEWGTGKTTLMSLIQTKLRAYVSKEVFAWDNIQGNNNDSNKLKNFLKRNFNIDWIKDFQFIRDSEETISISDGNSNIIVDKKGTYEYLPEWKKSNADPLSITLNDKKDKATLFIGNNAIREFSAKEEDHKINVYLQDDKILTVWFNAWRYERENQFALVALMKTIAYTMGELPTYREVKRVLLRGMGIIGKYVLRKLALKYAMTEKGVKEFEENLLPKMEVLSKVDKDTIYFDGIKKIEEEMKKIVKTNRIVVFIDDLDRCSPKTVLEVFESTKVFLDIEGFVFIIGLSYDTLSKLISEEFRKIGVSGDEYIRKIIQVHVNVPKWKNDDITILINRLLNKVGGESVNILKDKEDLIATAAALNPRQVKRIINRFIVAHSVDPNLNANEFLARLALEERWIDFYRKLDLDKDFRELVKEYAHLDYLVRMAKMEGKKNDTKNPPTELENKVFNIDPEIWLFLDNHKDIIGKIITDWESYRESYEKTADPVNKILDTSEPTSNTRYPNFSSTGYPTSYNSTIGTPMTSGISGKNSMPETNQSNSGAEPINSILKILNAHDIRNGVNRNRTIQEQAIKSLFKGSNGGINQPQAVVAHENQPRETYYDNPLVDIMAFWQKSAIAWIEAYDNFLRTM